MRNPEDIRSQVREYMIQTLTMTGHKRRVRRAMKVLDEAMEAQKAFVVGEEEVIEIPDHRIRLMAVGLVGNFYGLEAPKQFQATVTVDLESRLRDAIEKAHAGGSEE